MNTTFFNTTELTNTGELVSTIFKLDSETDFAADLLVFVNQMKSYIFIKKDNPAELLFDFMEKQSYIRIMLADVDIINYIEKQFAEMFPEITLTKLN